MKSKELSENTEKINNCLNTLGITADNITAHEIRKRFRQLVMQIHPDLNPEFQEKDQVKELKLILEAKKFLLEYLKKNPKTSISAENKKITDRNVRALLVATAREKYIYVLGKQYGIYMRGPDIRSRIKLIDSYLDKKQKAK